MPPGQPQRLGRDSPTGQATLETIDVATPAEMHEATNQYLVRGFTITSQTADTTTLVKVPLVGTTNLFATIRDQHWPAREVVTMLLLTCCCVVPGVLYLRGRLRAHATTENVVIRARTSEQAADPPPVGSAG